MSFSNSLYNNLLTHLPVYFCPCVAAFCILFVENRLAMVQAGGMTVLLQRLAYFKKRDPTDSDQSETMENLFDATCSLLLEPEGRAAFLAEEGMALMLILLR